MKNVFELLVAFAIMFMCVYFMQSCTPQKRFNKLIAKNPQLVKGDSVLIKDSILIKGKHAVFNFDTTINYYHSNSNGIDIIYKKANGQNTIITNTSDSIYKRNYYNYTNNYTTVQSITFKDKVLIVLTGFGVIAIVILIMFILIKLLKIKL